MAIIFAFHTGKPIVEIAAVERAINNLLNIMSPESLLLGEMLVIKPDKGFKMVRHALVTIGILRVMRPVNGCEQ
jgi:hypothetical protein